MEALKVKARVDEVLATAEKARQPGAGGALYKLSELGPIESLGCGYPTLRSSRTGKSPRANVKRADSDAEFAKRLANVAPALSGFDLKAHGMVLAGGLVSALVMTDKGVAKGADGDLFLVGHTDESAKKAISALGDHLAEAWPASTGTTFLGRALSMHVHRTDSCVTFTWGDDYGCTSRLNEQICTIQVVLRHYNTPAEVVYGFDMGSCSMLWDGQQVLFSSLGKFAAEAVANIVDVKKRRWTYEKRLCRYFYRGFDIILPNLDAEAMVAEDGKLPYLAAGISGESDHCGCHLVAYYVDPVHPSARNRQDEVCEQDAGQDAGQVFSDSTTIPYHEKGQLFTRNLKAICRAANDAEKGKPRGLCASAPYVKGMDITSFHININADNLIAEVTAAVNGNRIDISRTKEVLGTKLACEIAMSRIAHACDERDTASNAAVAANAAMAGAVRHVCTVRLIELVKFAYLPFAIKASDDCTLLGGAHPPPSAEQAAASAAKRVTPADWYGKAYKASKAA